MVTSTPKWSLTALLLALAGCDATTSTQTSPLPGITVAWRTPLQSGGGAGPSYRNVAADAQNLYILWRGVTAYNLSTGAERWRAPAVGAFAPENVLASGARVFTASDVVRALDAASGAEVWRFTPDAPALASAAVDERALYIGTQSRRVHALDVQTGEPFWSTEVLPPGSYRTEVTRIVAQGDTLYASLIQETSATGHLKRGWIVALDRGTGRVLWRYVNEKADEAHDASNHAVAGRMLLINDLNGGAFFGVDRSTGREAWRHVGPRDRFGARDVFKVEGGVAYLASNDTNVYAIDPETGQIIWQKELKGSASSSAVCGDHVFASMGSLHMLRRADGVEVANLFLDRDGFVEPSRFVVSRLLAHQGRVYFVGYDGVYAVECG